MLVCKHIYDMQEHLLDPAEELDIIVPTYPLVSSPAKKVAGISSVGSVTVPNMQTVHIYKFYFVK